jgi:hypothetical protein
MAVIPGPRSGNWNPLSLLERRWIPAFAGMIASGTKRAVAEISSGPWQRVIFATAAIV